ncbi:MAG: stimulus-sensing domain-containing protein [Alphaproteobacteria bacterium]
MTILHKLKRFMESVTATAKAEFSPDTQDRPHTWWLWRGSDEVAGGARHLSPLVLRILAVNVMALAILVGSLLYLGHYQDRIVATELDALLLQSRIITSAVSEGAIVIADDDRSILSPLLARLMVRRLAETTETRTRLFDNSDAQLADSRTLLSKKAKAPLETVSEQQDEYPPWVAKTVGRLFDMIDVIHERHEYPLYDEEEMTRGDQYEVVRRAKQGEMAVQVWRTPKNGLTLAAAVPVQHYKKTLGVVLMTRSDANINKAIATVRIDILKLFCITMMITILLSLYLARAIARPIRLLAMAAEGLRHGQMQIVGLAGTASLLNRDAIPNMTDRNDEIGDLSGALRDLTAALAQRIGAIENFAADVAHEIKNPLTSLRSAVETTEKVQDPAAQRKLMMVIRDDVDRLDRLITDIASASRLDAELSRDQALPIDVVRMLEALVDFYHQPGHEEISHAEVVLQPVKGPLNVMGVEVRLVQVLQNLIENALSFAPLDTKVLASAQRDGRFVRIAIEDNGPGIPDNKLDAIFDRFYSERPKEEKFGTHSGLGLSISKQIVEAHRGKIWAENIKNSDGGTIGARFVLRLPLTQE